MDTGPVVPVVATNVYIGVPFDDGYVWNEMVPLAGMAKPLVVVRLVLTPTSTLALTSLVMTTLHTPFGMLPMNVGVVAFAVTWMMLTATAHPLVEMKTPTGVGPATEPIA